MSATGMVASFPYASQRGGMVDCEVPSPRGPRIPFFYLSNGTNLPQEHLKSAPQMSASTVSVLSSC